MSSINNDQIIAAQTRERLKDRRERQRAIAKFSLTTFAVATDLWKMVGSGFNEPLPENEASIEYAIGRIQEVEQ